MEDKYGRYLVKKLFDSAFDDLEKKAIVEHICNNMEKFIDHMHASEVVEHIYTKSKQPVKEKMFEAVFGTKLKFLKVSLIC
jgi:isochorismate synthase EntC